MTDQLQFSSQNIGQFSACVDRIQPKGTRKGFRFWKIGRDQVTALLISFGSGCWWNQKRSNASTTSHKVREHHR